MATFGNIKKLASQVLHATESIVYTAPAAKITEVSTIWFHNRTSVATPQVVTVWFPFTASAATASFSASADLQRLSEGFSGSATLEISPKIPFIIDGTNSEKITMRCTQTSSVNVIIYGREEV